MEIWKDIQEYEGLYQVSNLGRVKSLGNNKTKKEKILKENKINNNYLRVSLSKECKRKLFFIHRLVAEAFIPNPNNYPCVNHKDENPSNNNVDNLEWCTHKYNSNYGTAIQRMIENNDWKQVAKKLSKPVLQYTKDGKFVREWESTKQCERNGYHSSLISLCCRGIKKSYKGFIWRYKNGEL